MESKNFEDLYEVLDVDLGSSKKEIIQKYKERINYYQNIIYEGNNLSEEEKWEIKLAKIAKYVLTNDELRQKYNVSRITMDSDESLEHNNNEEGPRYNHVNFDKQDVPLRKDKEIDLKNLADRQFQRFDHKNFDLKTDRELRG